MLPLFLHALFSGVVLGVNNGLARTPQMGWNNWNSLGCAVSESLLLDTSKILVDAGLKDVGYQYVVLDDCWQDGRGEDGYIRSDAGKFPHGMKRVAQQLHDMGLLYGMYSSAGDMTCARYEGSLDHEEKDAETWVSWDIDYLKYDNCFHRGRFGYPEISFNRYDKMAKALNATGRPILYSLCSWGEDYVHTWGMSIANSWRMSGDIYDHFNRPDDLCACDDAGSHCVAPGFHCSVMNIINKVAPYVDRGTFLHVAALKSPLLIGADLRTLSAQALTILNNPAVIAINQGPLGRSVARILRDLNVKKDRYGQGEVQIWTGPLFPHDQLVVFLNAADEDLEMTTTLNDVFVHEGPEGSATQTEETFDAHDLWANRMDIVTAEKILTREQSQQPPSHAKEWYNATVTPYKDGLLEADPRLLGQRIGSFGPDQPVLRADVPRHGIRMFRLRNLTGGGTRYALHKDEL
ncbi:glycoside hydrolase superfamily [Exophiala viscosa]|uniref:Alpha-galactosidase n=1 Tax=Exophiala viscosa TaxID=2486360 RepID=A0AAN6ICA4_9EURO|nr:glycoside hydrolase superfamily [Exophiala viscosa]